MKKSFRYLSVFVLGLTLISPAVSAEDLSNAEKAVAVLQSFQSGDATAMKNYVNPKKYIQHNPGFPDGIGPVVSAVETGAFAGTLVNTYRAISDGDFAVVQSLYSGAWNNKSPLVVIDVFRFEDGFTLQLHKIVTRSAV